MEKKTVPLARFAHRVFKSETIFCLLFKIWQAFMSCFYNFFSGFLCKLESVLIAAVPNFEEREREKREKVSFGNASVFRVCKHFACKFVERNKCASTWQLWISRIIKTRSLHRCILKTFYWLLRFNKRTKNPYLKEYF